MKVPLFVNVWTYVIPAYITVIVLTKLPEYAIVCAKLPMGSPTPFDAVVVVEPAIIPPQYVTSQVYTVSELRQE